MGKHVSAARNFGHLFGKFLVVSVCTGLVLAVFTLLANNLKLVAFVNKNQGVQLAIIVIASILLAWIAWKGKIWMRAEVVLIASEIVVLAFVAMNYSPNRIDPLHWPFLWLRL